MSLFIAVRGWSEPILRPLDRTALCYFSEFDLKWCKDKSKGLKQFPSVLALGCSVTLQFLWEMIPTQLQTKWQSRITSGFLKELSLHFILPNIVFTNTKIYFCLVLRTIVGIKWKMLNKLRFYQFFSNHFFILLCRAGLSKVWPVVQIQPYSPKNYKINSVLSKNCG